MIINPHQHSCSEVKLVKELSDKDVGLNQVLLVGFLSITDDLSEPFPLLLGTGHPDEEHLHTMMASRWRLGYTILYIY